MVVLVTTCGDVGCYVGGASVVPIAPALHKPVLLVSALTRWRRGLQTAGPTDASEETSSDAEQDQRAEYSDEDEEDEEDEGEEDEDEDMQLKVHGLKGDRMVCRITADEPLRSPPIAPAAARTAATPASFICRPLCPH